MEIWRRWLLRAGLKNLRPVVRLPVSPLIKLNIIWNRKNVLNVGNGKTLRNLLGKINPKVKDILNVKNVEEKQIIKDMQKILIEEKL